MFRWLCNLFGIETRRRLDSLSAFIAEVEKQGSKKIAIEPVLRDLDKGRFHLNGPMMRVFENETIFAARSPQGKEFIFVETYKEGILFPMGQDLEERSIRHYLTAKGHQQTLFSKLPGVEIVIGSLDSPIETKNLEILNEKASKKDYTPLTAT